MIPRWVTRCLVPVAALAVLAPAHAFADGGGQAGHTDPVAPVLIGIAIILTAAKIGGDLAVRIGQPAVLGELVFGVLIGNLGLFGFHGLEHMAEDESLELLAQIGVIILLYEVGLESTIGQMLKVGVSSLLVAILGVAAPFVLGWLVGAWLLPDESVYAHAFLGATLTATSVGITARVLQDLGKSQTTEARIILGAAVLDDVMGLVILAVVGGIIAAAAGGGHMSAGDIAWTLGKAVGFLGGALLLGRIVSSRMFRVASMLRARGVLLAVGLIFCFVLSWLASQIGLAPIVGAFAAGLILEDVQYQDFLTRGEHQLEELIAPISSFLVPIFFVLMGMRTDLRSFGAPGVGMLAAALVVAAFAGKQVCGFGVIGRGIDRLSVGIGMIPRGEVGLIFASIGRTLQVDGEPVIDRATFSAVVVMVIVTTVVTPPALKWSLHRPGRPRPPRPAEPPAPEVSEPAAPAAEPEAAGSDKPDA